MASSAIPVCSSACSPSSVNALVRLTLKYKIQINDKYRQIHLVASSFTVRGSGVPTHFDVVMREHTCIDAGEIIKMLRTMNLGSLALGGA